MRAHDAICGGVGLLLFGIAGLADGQLGMDGARAQQLLHGLIAGLLLQLQGRMQFGRRVRCSSALRRGLVSRAVCFELSTACSIGRR